MPPWSPPMCSSPFSSVAALRAGQRPVPDTSTERAELENFADAVHEKRPLAIAGGDEQHNVTVLEAILESAAKGKTIKVP